MSASDFARQIPDGGPVRWKAMELAAYDGEPRLQLTLDPSGASRQHKGGLSRELTGKMWLGVAFIVVPGVLMAFAPVAGFVTLFRTVYGPGWAEHTDASVDLAVAAAIFAADAIYLIVMMVLWRVSARFRLLTRAPIRWQSGVAAGLGAAAFIVAAVRGAQASVAGWQFLALPILATVVLATVQLVLLRDDPKLADAGGGSPDAGSGAPVRGVRETPRPAFVTEYERLSAETRAAIAADLASAIDILEARGLISSKQADWAREAKAGALARHMSQPRQLR